MESASAPAGFGTLLRQHRQAAGLTQEALAEQSGLSVRSIQDLERGVAHPRADTTERLLAALGLHGEARAGFLALARPAPRHPRRHLVDAPPAPGLPARAGGEDALALPVAVSSFIGREREVTEIRRLLATIRLLTLTGSGGVGKTRLALQVAQLRQADAGDGVGFVELAALTDPALAPSTVAAALGVRETPGRPILATLLAALHTRRLLLVLDNCEHVIDACAELAAALLRACPSLQVLATSREALGITGEVAWRVPSLAVPDPRQPLPLEEAARVEAVALFLDRAAAIRPGFALTAENLAAVARVCAHLDGIPLALELAAARTTVLSVEQIAERLDDRFQLLTRGSRTALPRQQTLRATLDWSYDLLSAPERALLRRLAVFAGGWTLAAAEAVGAGEGIAPADVLDLLARLVDKSLVQMEATAGGEERYRLLETVRQYAAEQLAAHGEAEALRRRHAAHYLGLAEAAAPQLFGPESLAWLARLEGEHDNLRAALAWLATGGEAETGLRLGAALAWFWGIHGYLAEGRDWLTRLLALPGAARSPTRAAALLRLGVLAWAQGDYRAHRQYNEESLTLAQAAGDEPGIAYALSEVGVAAVHEGCFDVGQALLEESLTRYRDLGDRVGIALALQRLAGIAWQRGEYATADRLFAEAMALRQALQDRSGVAHVLSNMGWMALYRGDLAAARALQEEALTIRHELGDRREVAVSLTALGRVAFAAGDGAEACALYRESLPRHQELGNRWGLALALEGLVRVAAAGQPAAAVRLAGAAAEVRAAMGRTMPPVERAGYEQVLAGLRARLGAAAFAAAWAAGQALALEQAAAEALSVSANEA